MINNNKSSKSILKWGALGGLALCLVGTQAQADDARLLSNPFIEVQPEIAKPAGQIFDRRYGVLSYQSGTELTLDQEIKMESHNVFMPLAGRIFYVEKNKKYHSLIKISHSNGSVTTIGGLDVQSLPAANKNLNKGDKIGTLHKTVIEGEKNMYFEHVLKSGYSLHYGEKDTIRTSFKIEPQQLALANYYNPNPPGSPPLPPGMGDGERPPLPPGVNPYDPRGRPGGPRPPSDGSRGNWGPGTGNNTGGASGGPGNMGPGSGNNAGGPSTAGPWASGYVLPGSGSDSAGGTNDTYANLTGDEAASAAAAAATATCPQSVREEQNVYVEARLEENEAIREAVLTEPASVNNLSCFDQFSTIMSTVVAESGISGSFSIFGMDVDIGQLAGMGADALSQGACNRGQQLLDDVRDRGIDINAVYSGFEDAQNVINSWREGDGNNVGTPPVVPTFLPE